MNPLRYVVVLLCCLSISACGLDHHNRVRTGLDVLQDTGFAPLRNGNVGLITNHTSVASDGRSSIDLLHNEPAVQLVAVFSPEHGIAGKLDIAEISDGVEANTGIPVISLYGDNRRPTAAMLAGIDVLVFDIQDVGTRFYTYISTLGYAMHAAAEHGIRFVVLDRPNPINGVSVAGPMLDDGEQSFVGFHRLPVRHGMTVAELATMFKAELALDLQLHVVLMENWHRDQFFDATGLVWINPSPNMRSLNAAVLYPGIGLLETTNLSVGRGTESPFELLGAPWLDGTALADRLNKLGFEGLRIEALRFTPTASTFAGVECGGIRLSVLDKTRVEPLQLGLAIARTLAQEYPDQWDSSNYMRLLGNRRTFDDVIAARPLADIVSAIAEDAANFRLRRAPYLLYH
jgi:uncharacterized protein YbbC (DUF1343 family)